MNIQPVPAIQQIASVGPSPQKGSLSFDTYFNKALATKESQPQQIPIPLSPPLSIDPTKLASPQLVESIAQNMTPQNKRKSNLSNLIDEINPVEELSPDESLNTKSAGVPEKRFAQDLNASQSPIDMSRFALAPNSPAKNQVMPQELLAQGANPTQKVRQPFGDMTSTSTYTQESTASSTPFQIFLDKAVDFFEMVSNQDNKMGTMMAEYVDGKTSLEELALIRSKVAIALTFTLTLLTQVTQTFKELQNMQV